MSLWRYDWSVQIGTLLIRPGPINNFTVKFSVARSTGREPNSCQIQIANLSDARVQELEAMDNPAVSLRAGYVGAVDTIFSGNAPTVYTVHEIPNRWTKIEASDAGDSYRSATIERSFAADTSVATVIAACAEAMDVGMGNAASVAADAELNSGGNTYATGTVLSGPAWRQLDRVCNSCGLRWSVQSGVLQLRARGRAAETSAVRLTPSTGLIGSPTRGEKDRRTRRVTYGATSLMRPGLYPGRVVRIESRSVNANLLCKKTKHTGDTTGGDWIVEMELQEYEAA